MDINCKPGHQVMYTGCSDSQVGGHGDPRGRLIIGHVYTVKNTQVRDWDSAVEIEGIGGSFNTVCFEDHHPISDVPVPMPSLEQFIEAWRMMEDSRDSLEVQA